MDGGSTTSRLGPPPAGSPRPVWATPPGPPSAWGSTTAPPAPPPPPPTPAPAAPAPRVVTAPPLNVGVHVGRGLWRLMAVAVLVFLALPTTEADARALVDDIDGAEATVVLVGHPQPNRYIVRWQGDLREGETVGVDLLGPCRCEVVPARTRRDASVVFVVLTVLTILIALLGWAWPLGRDLGRQRAATAAQGAADLPQAGGPVWIRPRWVGRLRPALHVDVHDRATGARLGRLPLGQVTIEMDPWVPYTLLVRDRAWALRSDDGRHLVLPVGPLDARPDDGRVLDEGPTIDEAMRWGPTGDDPAWARATKSTGLYVLVSLFASTALAYGLFLVAPDGVGLLVGISALMVAIVGARVATRGPLRRLIRRRTEAGWFEADLAAAVSASTLVAAVSITERRQLG